MSAVAEGVRITKAGSGLPSRVIVHGVEGVGKSSFACQAPKPIFLMTRGETGLLSLIDNGQVPETDHFDEAKTWNDLKLQVNYLIVNETEHKTLVLDTLNGAERLCFEHVTSTKFGGRWENFSAYGRGPESALEEWIAFLTTLDRLRERRRMAVIALAHTKIKTFKNPEGDDFDRYATDMHEKTWGAAAKWADAILFGNYETFSKKDKGELRAKGVSSGTRLFYTQRTAAYDAKNRLGLPPEIPMGASAKEAWANFFEAAKRGRAALSNTTTTTKNGE
jgi:hypothetical protein